LELAAGAQAEALYFARDGFRKIFDELNPPRVFVRRKPGFDVGLEL
jgi:hypothetical protein